MALGTVNWGYAVRPMSRWELGEGCKRWLAETYIGLHERALQGSGKARRMLRHLHIFVVSEAAAAGLGLGG